MLFPVGLTIQGCLSWTLSNGHVENEIRPVLKVTGSDKRGELLNRGGWGNGDVYLMCRSGRKVVLKTYADKPWLVRWIGGFLLRREKRAYGRLVDVPGVPGLLPGALPWELIVEFVDGEKISNALLARHGGAIVESLTKLVATMHQQGVYHLDLGNHGNILVDQTDHTHILDFASSIRLPPRPGLLAPLAWVLRRVDLYGLNKWAGRV